MDKFIAGVFVFLFFVFLVVFFGALTAIPTMLLINNLFSPGLLQTVFGGPISFLGAWGLNILCGLLFKTSVSSSSKKS